MTDLQEKKPTSPSDDEVESTGSNSLASTYGVNEKKLLAKLDLNLLPAVVVLYLLSFLDRSNGILYLDSLLKIYTNTRRQSPMLESKALLRMWA